jgi:hypothetical protein
MNERVPPISSIWVDLDFHGLVLAGLERVDHPEQRLDACRDRHVGPRALLECLSRCHHRPVDVSRRGQRDAADDFLGSGRDHREAVRAGWVLPVVSDEDLVYIEHFHLTNYLSKTAGYLM